jgi:hypothetical protein
MADLLALQPNMDIRLHIVAPIAKREKVFQEIRRPVFSLLERGPLSELCTYLSYDSLRELVGQKHLAHLLDTVLDGKRPAVPPVVLHSVGAISGFLRGGGDGKKARRGILAAAS